MLVVGAVTGPGELSATVVVPAQDPAPPPGKGPEFGNASPIGLVVVLLLLIATVVLIRSMSRRIRRLPESFDETEPDGAEGPSGGSGSSGSGSAGSDESGDSSSAGTESSGRG